jgi:hypothetical protein
MGATARLALWTFGATLGYGVLTVLVLLALRVVTALRPVAADLATTWLLLGILLAVLDVVALLALGYGAVTRW